MVKRLLSAAPFILKGEGWYVTDYPSASRKKALESEKSGSSASKDSAPAEKPASEKTEKSPAPASGSTPTSASAATPAKSSTD